ncbi:MAG: formate dehydrogenase subunit gamma [Hyphomicrobiales bacterium]
MLVEKDKDAMLASGCRSEFNKPSGNTAQLSALILPFMLSALLFMCAACMVTNASAQDAASETSAQAQASPDDARSSTGGAQTLEDILRRQRGEPVDDEFRRSQTGADANADAIRSQLGTRGAASDADIYRQLRFGTGNVHVSTGKQVDAILIQDGGMRWLEWREGPLAKYGSYALGGMIVLLAIFYLLRGRIKVEHGLSGVLIQRFSAIERFGHWLLAISFILLALTGLWTLFGRLYLIDIVGKETFSSITLAGKWVHNNVAWAFMAGLTIVFVQWVFQNIPNRHDIVWLLKGGGIFVKGVHPPSKKFNAGQKIIFWSVIILGVSLSASGLSLLFPFEFPMFAKTFAVINEWAPMVGQQTSLPTELQPHQEMQYAQLWHSIVAFAMIVIILAHIYIGSIGMQGAFAAMGSGKVDKNWAKEHHDLWVKKVEAEEQKKASQSTAPAE